MTTTEITQAHERALICQEDELRVLLPAASIPHGATVAKRGGEQKFELAHNLKLYQPRVGDQQLPAVVVEGFFLVGPRLSINQVQPDMMLHWCITADNLCNYLVRLWETPQ